MLFRAVRRAGAGGTGGTGRTAGTATGTDEAISPYEAVTSAVEGL
jgi:hypothetical protein